MLMSQNIIDFTIDPLKCTDSNGSCKMLLSDADPSLNVLDAFIEDNDEKIVRCIPPSFLYFDNNDIQINGDYHGTISHRSVKIFSLADESNNFNSDSKGLRKLIKKSGIVKTFNKKAIEYYIKMRNLNGYLVYTCGNETPRELCLKEIGFYLATIDGYKKYVPGNEIPQAVIPFDKTSKFDPNDFTELLGMEKDEEYKALQNKISEIETMMSIIDDKILDGRIINKEKIERLKINGKMPILESIRLDFLRVKKGSRALLNFRQ